MSSLLQLPAPGELLWSALARLQQRFPALGTGAVSRQAGFTTRDVGKFFTCQLHGFVAALAHRSKPTPELLLCGHTLFPLAAPLLPPDESRRLRESMLGLGFTNQHLVRHVHLAVGIGWSFRLRYCRWCVQQDRAQGGQPAWRAVHQVAALAICPIHRCELVTSQVQRRSIGYSALAREQTTGEPAAPNTSWLQTIIADGVTALTLNSHHELGPERLCAAMRAAAAARRGMANAEELWLELEEADATDTLELLGTPDERQQWLARVLGGENLPLRLEHYAAFSALLQLPFRQLLEDASRIPSVPARRPFMAREHERRAAALVPRVRDLPTELSTRTRATESRDMTAITDDEGLDGAGPMAAEKSPARRCPLTSQAFSATRNGAA